MAGNLPPGVTDYDVDRAACGGLDPDHRYLFRCEKCGWEVREKAGDLLPYCLYCGGENFEVVEE